MASNFVIIIGLIGLSATLIYIYSLDLKLKNLHKYIKDNYAQNNRDDCAQKNGDNCAQKNGDNYLQSGEDTLDIVKSSIKDTDHTEIVDNILTSSITSDPEIDENTYFNYCMDDHTSKIEELESSDEMEKLDGSSDEMEKLDGSSDEMEKLDGSSNTHLILTDLDLILADQEYDNIDTNSIITNHSEDAFEDQDVVINLRENTVDDEEDTDILINECRVILKSGAKRGQVCAKKTHGTPYCARHGLYSK
jgi:hypothetical protein